MQQLLTVRKVSGAVKSAAEGEGAPSKGGDVDRFIVDSIQPEQDAARLLKQSVKGCLIL